MPSKKFVVYDRGHGMTAINVDAVSWVEIASDDRGSRSANVYLLGVGKPSIELNAPADIDDLIRAIRERT